MKPTGYIQIHGRQYGKETEEEKVDCNVHAGVGDTISGTNCQERKEKPGFRVTNRNNDDFGWGDESDEETLVHTNQPILVVPIEIPGVPLERDRPWK